MFKKNKSDEKSSSTNGKATRTMVTETVETIGGVQTTRKTITTSGKDDFDTAFRDLNFDPESFKSGGTTVTKKVVYSSSGGQRQVVEETVESYEDPAIPNKKPSKSLTEKLGFKSSKPASNPEAAKTGAAVAETKVKPGKFEDDCLKSHNAYRSKHGVSSLKLNKQICAYAKEWADHLAATDRFEHRKERRYGENIYMKWSSDPNHAVFGHEAVDSWYSEIKDFTFGTEPTNLKAGHFTQVIWKDSKEMGVAWSRSKSGKVLVVANYDPPGNFVGRFAESVPPLKK